MSTLTPATPRTPTQCHNYRTRYEIVLIRPGMAPVAVAFLQKPSWIEFVGIAQKYRDTIAPLVDLDAGWKYSAAGGLDLGSGVVIRKSGRTERDAFSGSL